MRGRRRFLQEGRLGRDKLHRSRPNPRPNPLHQKGIYVRIYMQARGLCLYTYHLCDKPFGLDLLQVTSKAIVVYPNSGETYVAETKEWVVSSIVRFGFASGQRCPGAGGRHAAYTVIRFAFRRIRLVRRGRRISRRASASGGRRALRWWEGAAGRVLQRWEPSRERCGRRMPPMSFTGRSRAL